MTTLFGFATLRKILPFLAALTFFGLSACADNSNNNGDTDLCANVTCAQPDDTCGNDGDKHRIIYTGPGVCNPVDGTCDFSEVEKRDDCVGANEVCVQGQCPHYGPPACAAGPSCEQPEDTCDGDIAVTYSGDGVCDETDESCDFSAVETRTDCSERNLTCLQGACVIVD